MRYAAQEIGRSVQWVDDEAGRWIDAHGGLALLADEAALGELAKENRSQDLLGFQVGFGYEIGAPLGPDLELRAIAKLAQEPAPGGPRCTLHD